MSEPRAAASQVISIAEQVEARFRGGRRVLSFAEFLALFDADPRALLARREPLPARRLRPLRQDDDRPPVGRVHALQSLRPAVGAAAAVERAEGALGGRGAGRQGRHRATPAARRAHRPGAGAGRDLPRALQLRARGSPEPPRAPSRPERLGQVDHRVVHDGGRSSTTRRSTRARSTGSTGCSRRRRRSAARSASRSEKSAAGVAQSYAHLVGRRDRREAHRRGARPPALSHPRARAAAPPRGGLQARGRHASRRATGSSADSSRTRASRSSRRSSPRTTARTSTCSSTCRSSATSSRAGTASGP